MKKLKKFISRTLNNSWVITITSLLWLILRTGTKPSRVVYPCQQAARTNLYIFGLPALIPFWTRLKKCKRFRLKAATLTSTTVFLLLGAYGFGKTRGRIKYLFRQLKDNPRIKGTVSAQSRPKVVWVNDNQATTGKSWSNAYDNRLNQTAVNEMMDKGIKSLTGANSVAAAWRAIFIDHQGRDYQAGEKIAIKLNFNNKGENARVPLPQPVRALVRQLVVEKGVNPTNITLYEIDNAPIPSFFGSSNDYYGVNIYTERGSNRCDSGIGVGWPGEPTTFGCVVTEADYIINMNLVSTHNSSHGGPKVTLSFKNHFGSVLDASNLSHNHVDDNRNPIRNNIFLLNNHPQIKNKQILVVGDGLWALVNHAGPVGACDFKGNSLFFSLDPVAADSVMRDFIFENSNYLDITNFSHENSSTYLELAMENGLGVYECSCTGRNNCTFNYENIDLVKCHPSCPGIDPTATSSPISTPTPLFTPTSTPTPIPTPTSDPLCVANVAGGSQVGTDDFVQVLSFWGQTTRFVNNDISDDGKVNGIDPGWVIAGWGTECE